MSQDYNLVKIYEQLLEQKKPLSTNNNFVSLTEKYNEICFRNHAFLEEKSLNWADFTDALRKYSRLTTIDNKIKNQTPFDLQNGTQEPLVYSDKNYSKLFAQQKVEELRQIGGAKINQFPFFKTKSGQPISFKDLVKSSEFGGKGAKAETSERQERGLIDHINSIPGVKTIISQDNSKIENIIAAEKVERQSKTGPEPYSDVKLILPNKVLFVSAKGQSAPTLGSGGIAGIRELTKNNNNPKILNFVADFYRKAYEYYKNNIEMHNLQGQNLYRNKIVPDVSIKVPSDIITSMLAGTAEMGGPVSYYYIGQMNVEIEKSDDPNTIKIKNGNFVPLETFIEKYGDSLYAHIRKRDGDLYFTDATIDLNGKYIPVIFSKKKNGQGGAQSRFGVINKIRGHLLS